MKSGELFAGVGGLGRAVDAVFGSEPAWFAEFDPAPSKVLAHHYPDVLNHGDVTKITAVEHVQILAGGFPCQDVSLAGRRRGLKDGTRSGLWSEFARLIGDIRPDWVVIENVRGLLSADATGGDLEPCPWCVGDDEGEHTLRALGAVLGDLADLGFDAEWTGLRAADVGAPHGRFRVFILAWPSENTRRGGSSGRAEGQKPTWSDDATVGSDQRRDRGRADNHLNLLPTTTAADSRASGGDPASSNVTLTDAIVRGRGLLPRPVAQPSGNSPEDHLRKKPGRGVVTDLAIIAENGLIESGGRLLPTPGAYDGNRGGSQHPDKRREGGHSVTIQDVTEHLLPTPQVADATGGHAHRSGARSDELMLPGAARELSRLGAWGPYAEAIARWESIVGRLAPSPVRHDGKGGKARLNPELTEWMMGWPEGWVTDPAIGLTRNEELKVCGNGVVTLQATAALRELLSRPGVPSIVVA